MLLSYNSDCFSVNCIRSFDAVTEMVQASILACEDSLQMIRARAAAEECHARNLSKIASMELRYCKGSLQESMDQLKSDIKHKAKQHVVFAENITQDIYEPIHDLKTQLLSRQKSLLTQYANIQRDMKHLENNYLKSWTAFDKSYADAHYQWTVCKATGVSEPFLTLDMFKDLRSTTSTTTKKSQPTLTKSNRNRNTNPQQAKTKQTLKDTLSGVTSSISGISAISWMSAVTANGNSNAATATSGIGSNSSSSSATATTSSATTSSTSTFSVGSNLLSSALSTSSSTLNAIVNKNLTGKDLLDWALNGANNMNTGNTTSSESSLTAATAADSTHTIAVQRLKYAERLRRKCLEHWQVLVNATQRAAIKVQVILTKLQGMVETFQILMSEYLKKFVVFECSAVANQQYDLQMLFKVFETVDIERDLIGFMSQHNTSFQPSEYPTLSDIMSTATHPNRIPPPPCGTLLACPVTKSAPYIQQKDKLFALRLPLLVRPVDQNTEAENSEQLCQQGFNKTQQPLASTVAVTDEHDSSSGGVTGNTTGYGKAEDVLKCLIELSNSLKKQKEMSNQTSTPNLLINNNNNNGNIKNNNNNSADDNINLASNLDPLVTDILVEPNSILPTSPPSSFTSSNQITSTVIAKKNLEKVADSHPHSFTYTSSPPPDSSSSAAAASSTSVAVISMHSNNNNDDDYDETFSYHQELSCESSTTKDCILSYDEIPVNRNDENGDNNIDVVEDDSEDDEDDKEGDDEDDKEGDGEEVLSGDPEKDETDPLWTLPSTSASALTRSKENITDYFQPELVFSDAKLLEAISLPRVSSPLTTRSLGNLDCLLDDERGVGQGEEESLL